MANLSYISPKATVQDSPIHGKGLFATQPINQGEIVAIKGGYVFDHATLCELQPQLGPAEIQIAEGFFIGPVTEAERAGGMIFSNHSCEPNIGVQGQIVFVALRDIAAGEELTHDWATTDDDTYELACHCGAPSCRQIITGQDWRKPELQQKYRAYLSWHLQQKIEREAITTEPAPKRLTQPRMQPLPAPEWEAETRELLSSVQRAGEVYNIFATLARHPKLLKRWLVFATHILNKSTLPARAREMVILRIGYLCHAEYEWGHHVDIGKQAGLNDTDIQRIAAGPDAPGLEPFEAALLRAADELHADSIISDATWRALAERYNTEQLLDLVFTIGQYTLVSMMLNSLGIQLEAGFAGLPREAVRPDEGQG